MAKVAAVTGAAGTLGRSVVRVLAGAGWTTVGIDRAELEPGAADLALGGVDLSDEAAVVEAAGRVRDRYGRLDGLANVAGGFRWETVEAGSLATWDAMFAINVRTALASTRAFLPLLREAGGAVVNVGAAASARATAGMGAYAASKAGVSRLTEALAEELKEEGVRVNAVLPSILDTPANRSEMADADFGRWVRPEALAEVIAFLLSPAAGAVTGALLPVTGRV